MNTDPARPDPGPCLEPGQLLPAALLPRIRRGGDADQRVRRGRPVPAPAGQRPRPGQPDRKEGDVLRTRSVSLSSERLGITGKLDLLEEERRRDPAGRNQAVGGAQGRRRRARLLGKRRHPALRPGPAGRGKPERHGPRRNHLLRRLEGPRRRSRSTSRFAPATLAAIALIRDLAGRDVPPEPLPAELRHRCFGCSLAPVCLPEETLYLIHQPRRGASARGRRADAGSSAPAVRLPRVIPKNDDKAVLYVQEPGAYVGRRGEHLVVSLKGQEIKRVPIVSIRQVVVFGNVQVSTQALQTLVEADIPVAFLNMYGKFIATVMPAPPKNVALRAAQYQAFADPARALALARAVVAAKIANQRTLLMRSLRSLPRSPSRRR